MNAIESNAAVVKQSVIKPARDRVGFISGLLRLGKRPSKEGLSQLQEESVQVAIANAQAAEIEVAKQAAIADLQQEANALVPSMQAAGKTVAEAHFEAAREKINAELVPQFFTACEQLRIAYAKVVGAGAAHNELAKRLRDQHALSAQAAASTSIAIDIPCLVFRSVIPRCLTASVLTLANSLTKRNRHRLKSGASEPVLAG